jgi:hypothetical protein
MDFPEIPHSNLSHFRSRLVVHELEGQVFDRLAEMATEAGVVDPSEQQAIDSSHIFGAAPMFIRTTASSKQPRRAAQGRG